MGKWKLKWTYLSNCKHLKDVTKLSYTPTETSELYVFRILASFNDDFNFMRGNRLISFLFWAVFVFMDTICIAQNLIHYLAMVSFHKKTPTIWSGFFH